MADLEIPLDSGTATVEIPAPAPDASGTNKDITWVTPDLAVLFATPNLQSGLNVGTINSDWAFVGNNAKANFEMTAAGDGYRDGRMAVCTLAAVVALLGITEDDILNGVYELCIEIDPQSDPGSNNVVGMALVNDSTRATMDGSGGGYRGSTIGPNLVVPSTTEASLDNGVLGSGSEQLWNISKMLCTYPIQGIYCIATVYQQLTTGPTDGAQFSTTGVSTALNPKATPLYLTVYGGSNAAATVDADMNIRFGCRAGPHNSQA